MAPPDENVKVAVEALRADAAKWAAGSDVFEAAATSAAALTLGVPQFSWVADKTGITATYLELQQKLSHLLAGAATETDRISAALKKSADTYEREDLEGAHKLKKAGG